MPSIHPSRAAIGLLLFAVLFLAALGYVIDQEIGQEGQGAMATMVAVAQALGSVAVSLTALTVIIVEGVPMLYEAFKKAKLAQGRAQGRAAERQAWEDWIARRDAAHAAGLDFTEPSPAQRERRATVAS